MTTAAAVIVVRSIDISITNESSHRQLETSSDKYFSIRGISCKEGVNGKPAELLRSLVPMKDAQVIFKILRLSVASRLSHLLRTVPSSITHQAAAAYDALVEWALVSTIADDGAAAAGLPTLEEVAHDPIVLNPDVLGTRGSTAGQPAHPRRRSRTYP